MGFIGKQPAKAAITSSDITDGIVTADKLASDSVTTAKIADNGVTTAKINADAVTDAKIADDVVGSEHLTAGEVDTTALGADAVTAAKIADDAISEEHLDATVITGMTELAAEPADTDEFLISDAGTLKRIDYSHIKGGGITEVDVWKMSDQTYSHDDLLTTGWSRYTTLNGAPQGTGLSESSGVFTFPSTGVYKIDFQTYFWNNANTRSYLGVDVRGTNDAFSSNTQRLTIGYTHTSVAQDHSGLFLSAIYDVTNTSNNKLRFQAQGSGTGGYYHTYLIATKLMET